MSLPNDMNLNFQNELSVFLVHFTGYILSLPDLYPTLTKASFMCKPTLLLFIDAAIKASTMFFL